MNNIHEKDKELRTRRSRKSFKARGEYVCYRCEADIERGDMHEVSKGKVDGIGKEFRLCEPCSQVVY